MALTQDFSLCFCSLFFRRNWETDNRVYQILSSWCHTRSDFEEEDDGQREREKKKDDDDETRVIWFRFQWK